MSTDMSKRRTDLFVAPNLDTTYNIYNISQDLLDLLVKLIGMTGSSTGVTHKIYGAILPFKSREFIITKDMYTTQPQTTLRYIRAEFAEKDSK